MKLPNTMSSAILMPVMLLALNTGTASVQTSSVINANSGEVHSTVETHVESSQGSDAEVNVENNVESSNTSTTTIRKKSQVTVNGETKTIESTTSTSASPTHTPTPQKPPKPDIMEDGITAAVKTFLKDLFGKLFK